MFQGRPVIAVTPLYDPERQAAWVYQNYLDSLEEQGAIPLVPPFSQDPAVLDYFLEGCDGLLLTGGCDIDPGLYGQPLAGSQEVCPLRDRLDSALLAGMLERDRPVLGICRGFQLLNILLGGDLWQDLPTQRPSAVLHRMGLPYNRAAHRVDLEPGSQPGFIPSHRNIQTVLQQPGALQNQGFATRPNCRPSHIRSVFLERVISRQSKSPRCRPRISISALAKLVATGTLCLSQNRIVSSICWPSHGSMASGLVNSSTRSISLYAMRAFTC